MDAFQEARKERDDFDDLMAACDVAKLAIKKDHSVPSNSKEDKQEKNVESPSNVSVSFWPTPAVICQDKNEVAATKRGLLQPSVAHDRSELPHSAGYADSQLDEPPPRRRPTTHHVKLVEEPQVLGVPEVVPVPGPAGPEKDDNGFVYYKCRFCGLTFNYMNTLRAHERIHNVSQPYVCGKCGESFDFACQLEYHAAQHSEVSGYKCECGRTFFSYTEMLYHKHTDDPLELLTTQQQQPEVLVVRPANPNPAPTVFDLPLPAYATEGFEPKHPLKVYSDVRSKPYICEYCSKSYSDSRGLAYHMYSHRGEKQFNPRASRYLIGRQGVGYTDARSYYLFPRTSGYVPPRF